MNQFGNKEHNKFSFILPGVYFILMLLMSLVGYIKAPKEIFKGFSDKTLIYSGAVNGDSPLFRVFTSSFLQSSVSIFGLSLVLLVITWIYIEKIYGFSLYIVSFIALIIISGLLGIYVFTSDPTASSIPLMAGLTGMIAIAYWKLKEQDIMIVMIINLVLIIASFFVPGHQAISILLTMTMLIIGIIIGFIATLTVDKMSEIEQSNRYKQQIKEEEKARREQERLQKQRDKIRKKHKR